MKSIVFMLGLVLVGFASIVEAGIGLTERNEVKQCSVMRELWGDWQTIHFTCDGGPTKVVIVAKESESAYAVDEAIFVAGFQAIYPYAPAYSLLRMKREDEAPGVHIKFFEYDMSSDVEFEYPYAAGSGLFTSSAMVKSLRSVCIIDKNKAGCAPARSGTM